MARKGGCAHPSVRRLSQLGSTLPCPNPPLTPGLVWSLQGPAVTTGLTWSWNPAGIATAGGVRKHWSMRAEWDKIPMRRVAWSAAVLSSWSCVAWLGHHVPQCHVPGVVTGLVTALVSRSCPLPSLEPVLALSKPSDPPKLKLLPSLPQADTGPAPSLQALPQRCQSCAPGALQALGPPQPCPRWGQTHGGPPCRGDTLSCSGRCGPDVSPAAGSRWEVMCHQGWDVPTHARPL